jgi:hypothetical protein
MATSTTTRGFPSASKRVTEGSFALEVKGEAVTFRPARSTDDTADCYTAIEAVLMATNAVNAAKELKLGLNRFAFRIVDLRSETDHRPSVVAEALKTGESALFMQWVVSKTTGKSFPSYFVLIGMKPRETAAVTSTALKRPVAEAPKVLKRK